MEKTKTRKKEEMITFKQYSDIISKISKKLDVTKDIATAALIKAQGKGIDPIKWQKYMTMLNTFVKIMIKAEHEPVEEDRDYKDEYKKFQSSKKMKTYRVELNRYNRKRGTYGNKDKKDASHKNGKIVGFEDESANRGRAEKSRLKEREK
jgi:hypothetical protein